MRQTVYFSEVISITILITHSFLMVYRSQFVDFEQDAILKKIA